MPDPQTDFVSYQRRLFELFSEIFRRATTTTPEDFATFENFPEVIKREPEVLAPRVMKAFIWADENLRPFYAQEAATAYANARQLGGLKLVQGGGSGFLAGHFGSVRASLLYADTVLIPDPVLPWFETERAEEQFRDVKLLQRLFAILHLKPLVDADFAVPPVCVFPSMEKALDENDETTQRRTLQLITDVFAHFIDPGIETVDDAFAFANRDPERFLERVDSTHLFVAPGGPIGERLAASLARYNDYLETWRTPEWLESHKKLPAQVQVMQAIMERLSPHYHLLENSEELDSHPLLTIEQQAHYFRLIAETNSARLTHLGLLDTKRQALINGMSHSRLSWLNGLSIEALIELRRNGENEGFRERLSSVVQNMHKAQLFDIDRVAAEIYTEISRMLREHEREAKEIQDRYGRAYGRTAVAAWTAASATLIPSLAPFVGAVAPFAVAAKYTVDKMEELRQRKIQARSLMGFLAKAHNEESGSA